MVRSSAAKILTISAIRHTFLKTIALNRGQRTIIIDLVLPDPALRHKTTALFWQIYGAHLIYQDGFLV
jgi:hypothetical protein